MDNIYQSRFVKKSDPIIEQLIFPLPQTWWSRFYEYKWALNFISSDDVILDAACGISHPFKFFLSDICDPVYACDIDSRITSREEIIKDIINDFSLQDAQKITDNYFDKLNLSQCNLTCLPYAAETFDKIFCISVLEHLGKSDIEKALNEFKRVLKNDGAIILTFDYPTIDLSLFQEQLKRVGLEFFEEVTLELSEESINSNLWGETLYCFRSILKKSKG